MVAHSGTGQKARTAADPAWSAALAVELSVLEAAALWITSITDGRAGLRALFARGPCQTWLGSARCLSQT